MQIWEIVNCTLYNHIHVILEQIKTIAGFMTDMFHALMSSNAG